MKRNYESPELEIYRFNESVMAGEEPVSTVPDPFGDDEDF